MKKKWQFKTLAIVLTGMLVVNISCNEEDHLSNQPPVAYDVNFSGTLIVGEMLTGSYEYWDNENDLEGATTYQWYRSDGFGANGAEINGATALTYTLQAADNGKFISFEVTPMAQTGISLGMAVLSGYQGLEDPGTSTIELMVKQFASAPTLDGVIDDMWGTVQSLTGTTEVPILAARNTYLNDDGEGIEESLGLFEPYSGEKYDFKLRSGYSGDRIYFLLEWDDADDSKDRQSWYFDPSDNRWKGEHKYANAADDKYYEDKFAFFWPIGEVSGFNHSTCYAACHTNLAITSPKQKHTRHYLTTEGEKIDMWHWKRVRGTYLGQVDDQKTSYVAPPYDAGSNGRSGDATGTGGYSNNSQELLITGTTDTIHVPKYVIPDQTDYYWISIDEINNGTAKLITAVDANGVLTYDGGTIDPADGGYEHATGNKRFPSVTTKAFTEGRADIDIVAVHTGTAWICEFTRKLNTGDADDVVFDIAKELPFGLAIFNNAAIAHAIKPNLMLRFEQ